MTRYTFHRLWTVPRHVRDVEECPKQIAISSCVTDLAINLLTVGYLTPESLLSIYSLMFTLAYYLRIGLTHYGFIRGKFG
jgi:hypothetical protein